MSRRFIAAVLAISTTIAGFSAAPARAASEEDIARLLAGAATIFIIGKAIQNSRDSNDDDKKSIRHHTPKQQFNTYQNPRETYHKKPVPKIIQRDHGKRNATSAIPANCVQRISGGRVNRVVMERCLERSYRSARSLPKACRMTVKTQRGTAGAYALPCLRQRGYTLARN